VTPEQAARGEIDKLLEKAGWQIFDAADANIHAACGVAIREFPLKSGHGFADYLLYLNGKAVGVIEAKKKGGTLSGVEVQSDKYALGLPDGLPAWAHPLPFAYQSTGAETRFTNGLDPVPRARSVFAFHRPEHFAELLSAPPVGSGVEDQGGVYEARPATFLGRLEEAMPELREEGLWPAQIKAINNLEQSLRENRPRALIQMATGSGKTFTSISFIYRLIKFAGARRVLFLVDRGNLGDQTLKEFQQYVSPYNNFKFSEEYIVQRLSSNTLDTTARVCICTIQRMYSMLRGKELPPEDEEISVQGLESLFREQPPIEYNPEIPIETFDIIVTDECHRSIYNLWAQVLEYFDAYLIGLTATPNKQTFGFFHQNLVMEYPHEQAVADGVNVNYDVYRIKTQITEGGSKVEAGYYVEQLDRETREKRWQALDEDLEYQAKQLDRDVVTPDQIRTVVKTFKEKLFTEIFPGRTEVPKTLFFAKDDNHAENIVEILREEFGKGNDFAQKITYRTTGATPKELIKAFRNSYFPRIAVTVDMIATGTDIKPVEIVVFMRTVKSRSFFEQMKGRGVRVIKDDDLKAVTPDAITKDHFVIVDAVGVCEQDKTDAKPMEKKPAVSFEKLLQAVSFGNTEEAVLTSIAGRLARMEHRLSEDDDNKIRQLAQGLGVKDLSRQLVEAVNPDRHREQAKADLGIPPDSDQPVSEQALQAARANILQQAVQPLHDPKLRELLVEVKKQNEITVDHVSQDEVIEAGFSADAAERARGVVQSFEQFIEDHKDEITALQVLYSKPYKARLSFDDIKELADQIQAPPNLWNESQLWQAYAALEKTKVKGAGGRRILTDLVSLVRFAIHQDNELVPFPERVQANFNAWLAGQAQSGKQFSAEQRHWLEMIRDHIAANLGIETDDFEYAPFSQEGGLGKVYQIFGEELTAILNELNEHLAA
jgi:type I restriction enzyme R subunit